ncbi:MAG: hypothetical protein ABSG32_11010 [Terriglobia bacterium]
MSPALTPGPSAAVGGMVVVAVVSMEVGAEAFVAAMVEAASAVVMEVIEVVTVAGDMDADGAGGDMGFASG